MREGVRSGALNDPHGVVDENSPVGQANEEKNCALTFADGVRLLNEFLGLTQGSNKSARKGFSPDHIEVLKRDVSQYLPLANEAQFNEFLTNLESYKLGQYFIPMDMETRNRLLDRVLDKSRELTKEGKQHYVALNEKDMFAVGTCSAFCCISSWPEYDDYQMQDHAQVNNLSAKDVDLHHDWPGLKGDRNPCLTMQLVCLMSAYISAEEPSKRLELDEALWNKFSTHSINYSSIIGDLRKDKSGMPTPSPEFQNFEGIEGLVALFERPFIGYVIAGKEAVKMAKEVILANSNVMVPFENNNDLYATSNDNKTGLFYAIYNRRIIIVVFLDSQGSHLQFAARNMDVGFHHVTAAFNVTNKLRALMDLKPISDVTKFFYLDLARTRMAEGTRRVQTARLASVEQHDAFIHARSNSK